MTTSQYKNSCTFAAQTSPSPFEVRRLFSPSKVQETTPSPRITTPDVRGLFYFLHYTIGISFYLII